MMEGRDTPTRKESTMASPLTCDHCKWWRFKGWQTDSIIVGECRRRAPHLDHEGERLTPVWPLVDGDDWCGDHIEADDNELDRRDRENEMGL